MSVVFKKNVITWYPVDEFKEKYNKEDTFILIVREKALQTRIPFDDIDIALVGKITTHEGEILDYEFRSCTNKLELIDDPVGWAYIPTVTREIVEDTEETV